MGDASGCLEKSDLVTRLVDESSKDSLCALWASRSCSAPKCVCHSSLKRIGSLERARECLSETHRSLPDNEVERLLFGRNIVICDICEKHVPFARDSFVWTCENTTSTILHARSYDICDACFVNATCTQ